MYVYTRISAVFYMIHVHAQCLRYMCMCTHELVQYSIMVHVHVHALQIHVYKHMYTHTHTQPQSVVLNGMVTPSAGSGSPVLHPSFGSINSQTFVINPTGQHSSPGSHPLMTSLSPHMGGLLPIRGEWSHTVH